MDDKADNISLCENLNRCVNSLRKLREVYSSPMKIERILETIEEGLLSCSKNCESQTEISLNYTFVSNKLRDIGRFDSGLRLYFSSSPYWEHYHRNVREIYSLLQKCRTVALKNNNEIIKFERKFVSMDQIVGCRSWGGSIKPKSLSGQTIANGRLASV